MKTIFYFIVAVAFCIALPSGQISAFAQSVTDPPMEAFGLRMGDTFAAATQRGLVASQSDKDGNLTTYKVQKLPNQPSNTDLVSVIFVEGSGLQKIIWASKDITDDPTGAQGKKQYQAIHDALSKKYGTPSNGMEETGVALYRDFDEFYECLEYAGCGMWVALWQGSYGGASVQIKSSGRRGQGWITVVYEGPAWTRTIEKREARQKQADGDAF